VVSKQFPFKKRPPGFSRPSRDNPGGYGQKDIGHAVNASPESSANILGCPENLLVIGSKQHH
jgi:hypothetical protein